MIRLILAGTLYFLQVCMYKVGSRVFFDEHMRWKWQVIAAGEAVSLILSACVRSERNYGLVMILAYLMAAVSCMILLDCSRRRRFVVTLTLFCIATYLDSPVGMLFDYVSNTHHLHDIGETVCTTGVMLLFGWIRRYIHIDQKRLQTFLRKYMIILVICMIFCQGFFIWGFRYALSYLPSEGMRRGFDLAGMANFLVITGLTVLIVYIHMIDEEMEQALAAEQELKKLQEQYYMDLLERERDTRRYRHDMNNHLLCLRGLSEKGKTEEVRTYVENMIGDFTKKGKKRYGTGNDVLDILLNHHLSELSEVEVTVTGRCDKKPMISDAQFCTILSNMIQNAVEEVNRQKMEQPYIKVEISQGKKYLMVRIRNRSSRILDSAQGRLETVKKDKRNHGIGLENIMDTVKRNGGSFELTGNGKEAVAELYLPCS